jgi:predicted RNase H-like nuclease (RuvC/YqgF family)
MHRFGRFLVVSCLVLAGASLFAPLPSAGQVGLSALALLSALVLVTVFRRRARRERRGPAHSPGDTQLDREPAPPQRRSRKRVHELEGRVGAMAEQLRAGEDAVDELRRTVQRLEAAARESERVEHRVDLLEAELRRQGAALESARQADEHRTRRLRATLAVHEENLTALERALDAPDPLRDAPANGSWRPLSDHGR